ncbi:TPA: hypothetical protein L7154_001678 [Escherichia coli]|nr:hypothetical protein [Escherichia coli]
MNTIVTLLCLRDARKLSLLAFKLIVVFLRSPDCFLHSAVTSVSPYAVGFQFATGLP